MDGALAEEASYIEKYRRHFGYALQGRCQQVKGDDSAHEIGQRAFELALQQRAERRAEVVAERKRIKEERISQHRTAVRARLDPEAHTPRSVDEYVQRAKAAIERERAQVEGQAARASGLGEN